MIILHGSRSCARDRIVLELKNEFEWFKHGGKRDMPHTKI